MSGGKKWWDKILESVRDCEVFIFALDPESLESKACMLEYGYAADLGKPILPVLIAEGVSINLLPPELSQIQFVDYQQQDRKSLRSLAKALFKVPSPKPLPDPLPPPPEVPVSYLGSLAEQIETTSTLSYEEQSVLAADLRRSLRNPDSANETLSLLRKLRKRRDLLATVADDIDKLLRSTSEASPISPKSPLNERLQNDETQSRPHVRKSLDMQNRMKGALILSVLGLTIAFLAKTFFDILNYTTPYLNDFLYRPELYLPIIFGGVIAGAICGLNRRGIFAALIGMMLPLFILTLISIFKGYIYGYLRIAMQFELVAAPLAVLVSMYVIKQKRLPDDIW